MTNERLKELVEHCLGPGEDLGFTAEEFAEGRERLKLLIQFYAAMTELFPELKELVEPTPGQG